MASPGRRFDPWTAAVAVVVGALVWALIPGVVLSLLLGVLVAAVIYGGKVAATTLIDRNARNAVSARSADDMPMPRLGGPAEVWWNRSEKALRSYDELVAGADPGPTREALESVRDEAADTVGTMRRLAGQVTALEQSMSRIPSPDLQRQHEELTAELARGGDLPADVRTEHERSLQSVDEQLAIYNRLSSARDTLLARMQSTTLGMEGLNARTGEIVAMAASSGLTGQDSRILELTDQLEGMRAGLLEVEELSRRALQPGDTLPPLTS